MRMAEKKITIEDIATALNVSTTTVSRSISGKGRISERTRQRVLGFIKESGYRPNFLAKGLAQSKTYNICVLMPDDCNLADLPFFQTVQIGICEELAKFSYDIVLSGMWGKSPLDNLKRIVYNNKVDGAILTRTVNDDPAINFLRKQQLPFVTIGSYPDSAVRQVDCDHYGGCYELTSALLQRGLKRLALLGGDELHIVTATRRRGFLDAYEAHDLSHPGGLNFTNLLCENDIARAVKAALEEKADCLVCMDDFICLSAIRTLRQEKIAIPATIKIASFFGSSLLVGQTPGITCLDFHTKELGMYAGKTLLNILGDDTQMQEKNLIGYEIVYKESTE